MRCGKTQELVDWAVTAITEDPTNTIMVMAANPDEGRLLLTQIREKLRVDHTEQIKNWKFTPWRIRTPEHGHVELFASRRDRVVRGYKFDEVLASDRCDPRIIETAKWAEVKPPEPKADDCSLS